MSDSNSTEIYVLKKHVMYLDWYVEFVGTDETRELLSELEKRRGTDWVVFGGTDSEEDWERKGETEINRRHEFELE